ncbi:MAG: cupredoxin domain-containing protein [Gemmatimonadaceae bacterium]
MPVTLHRVCAYTPVPMMKLFALLIPLALTGSALADVPAKTPSRIEVSVTKRGFDPDSINVPAKKPVTLVFTRKTDQTCTKSVVLTLDDGKKIERELPLDKPVEIAVTFPKAGKLGYACSMDMSKGVIVVQ